MSKPRRNDELLGQHLGDVFSEEEIASTWNGVRAGRAARVVRRERRRMLGVACGASLSITALALWILQPSSTAIVETPAASVRPIERADGAPFVGVSETETVVLDDHSRIVAGDETYVDVLRNDPEGISLHLERGRARFEITPHGPRSWHVEGGGVAIEVVGTVFEVERSDGHVRVTVERGVVLVRGAGVPDGVQRLVAGDAIDVAPAVARSAPPTVEPTAAAPTVERAAARAQAPTVRSERAEPAPTVRSGRAEPAPTSRTLLDEADGLRRDGEHERALEVLGTLVELHPRSVEAPLAAFTSAQLSGRRGDDDGARRWYQRALDLGLTEPLAEDARAALLELEVDRTP